MAILTVWELWACANECVRQHGFEARIFASLRIDRLEHRGDMDGARNWRLIIDRVAKLLADDQERLH